MQANSAVARIALDAMGGDQAPRETVRGALRAIEVDQDVEVFLVGDEAKIDAELKDHEGDTSRLNVVHASQVITGADSPVEALRSKRDASITKAAALVRDGEVHGMVAAGNTGAAVAAATLVIKLIPGVRRPGIAVPLPSPDGHTVLCDAGANIHCKPLHLFHYGIMAAQYARRHLRRDNPSVGLLNIGSEDGKGTGLVKETSALFASSKLNFVGNVEGNEVFSGKCDVIVCEGFVGNVVLKGAEGLLDVFASRLRTLLTESEGGEAAAVKLVKRFVANMDYAEYGGAPLIGINGLAIISHGRSNARAICNAILQAADLHRNRVLGAMVEDLKAS